MKMGFEESSRVQNWLRYLGIVCLLLVRLWHDGSCMALQLAENVGME